MTEEPFVTLRPVDAANWRECAEVHHSEGQERFVAPVTYYLALCAYSDVWDPLAVEHGGRIVGFCMWGINPADDSGWIGGLVIDRDHQGRGLGRASVRAAIEFLRDKGCESFALSYSEDNEVARGLYGSLGFIETGEREDDEIVARLR